MQVSANVKGMRRRKVALLTQSPSAGGTYQLVEFLYRLFAHTPHLEPRVICHLDWRVNPQIHICWQSICQTLPRLWQLRIRTHAFEYSKCRCVSVGALLPEWEPARYKSNRYWKKLLDNFDVIVVVGGGLLAGMPAVASRHSYVAWVATPYWEDRMQRVATSGVLRKSNFLIAKPFLNAIERKIVSNAALLMVLSHYTGEVLRKRYHIPGRKMRYVGCPVSEDLFRPLRGQPQTHRPVRLVSVGRFTDPRKNLPLLMAAFHHAHKRCNRITLTVAGAYDRKQVQGLKQKFPAAKNVRFLGFVSDEQKRGLLWQSDIFVLSSQQEGLGIVILEAMAAGLPIVSTDCGGPRSVVHDGETGFLVRNGDTKCLAEAIVELATSGSLRRRMGVQGQRLAREHHSENAVGSRVLQVIRKVYGL